MSIASTGSDLPFPFTGYAYDSDCIYINGTGDSEYEFYIQLNRCGTLGSSDHKKRDVASGKNKEPTVSNISISRALLYCTIDRKILC
jgi:hypothetical protein